MIVDDIDADLANVSWYLSLGYGVRAFGPHESPTRVKAHRLILERKIGRPLAKHELTDHINGNRLDNRRANLRAATSSQNLQNRHGIDPRNTSGYRGVWWNRRRRKWQAEVRMGGRRAWSAEFDVLKEAAQAAAQKRAELGFLNNEPPKPEVQAEMFAVGMRRKTQEGKS